MLPGGLNEGNIEGGKVNVHSLSFPTHAMTPLPDNSTAVVIISSPEGNGHRLNIHCFTGTRHVLKVKFPTLQAQEENVKNNFCTTVR